MFGCGTDTLGRRNNRCILQRTKQPLLFLGTGVRGGTPKNVQISDEFLYVVETGDAYVGHTSTLYHVLCEHYFLTRVWCIATENSDVSILKLMHEYKYRVSKPVICQRYQHTSLLNTMKIEARHICLKKPKKQTKKTHTKVSTQKVIYIVDFR